MYTKKFIALTEIQIAMVSKTVLAEKHKCSQPYVSKVLRSKEEPKASKALAILADAKKIIEVVETPAEETK